MIKGSKIGLRAMELSDIDFLYGIENDMANWNVSDTCMPFSRYTMEQYVLSCGNQDINTIKQLRLVIYEIGTSKSCGCIDLYDFHPLNLRAGVGILLVSEFRKKGYASEALELLIQYAFSILKIKQLYCLIAESNTDSLHLFEKHGFIQSGRMKSWLKLSENKWEDVIFLQYLPE